MTSTNDGKDVKSNQTSGQKGKTYFVELYKSLDGRLSGECDLSDRTQHLCEAWRRVHSLCQHSAPTTHPHLLSWLQRHTARTILQTEWQSPKSKDEHTQLTEAIDSFIAECTSATEARNGASPPWESQLRLRGEWFKKILENPWGHPVLRILLDPREQQPTDEEILEWLKEERGVMFVTRLRQLAASKCDDLAMSLVTAVMDRVRATSTLLPDTEQGDARDKPASSEGAFALVLRTEAGFNVEVWELVTDIEFVLLHKADRTSRCIELAKQTPLRDGYQLVERLQSRLENSPREKKLWKNAKEVATLIAQVIVARCMVVPICTGVPRTALYCCARSLARLVPRARLPAAAATLAAPAATARHLHTLASAFDAQCSSDMKPFVCELYVRAITAGMNELERLKLKTEKNSEARSAEQTLCTWFTQLGSLLSASDRIKCECTLTAFSVHPSPAMYDRIKNAPTLPPVTVDDQDLKQETTSEFGSWATDSRTQTNLVKTSETLNIKQTQQQNVLSTAILTEGETLGLSPELCMDLAVLLSGPRLKTLSWDMDRELLLENCRTYLERTHGGTRALTTELKYLNLDPSSYQHLPEEEDDENNAFYGIEKGYEHLVEIQEQDPLSPSAMFDYERTDTANSEDEIIAPSNSSRRKKKTKNIVFSSEEETDPLSLDTETKKEKKKERPHSKERSKDKSASKEKKERKKKTKAPGDSTENKEKSRERRKESTDTKQKKEPKEKKPRVKKTKEILPVEYKLGSLSSLIGMKVTKIPAPDAKQKTPEPKPTTPVTDSDYDSQGQTSLASLNSEGNGPDVLFDGLYTEEYRSPDKADPLSQRRSSLPNSEVSFARGQVTINLQKSKANNKSIPKMSHPQTKPARAAATVTSTQSSSKITDEVKKRISGLLEFRKQKNLLEQAQRLSPMYTPPPATPTPPPTMPPPSPSPHQTSAAPIKSPNAIVQPVYPAQQMISPKTVECPEIPKVYINQKQMDQIKVIRDEVDVYLKSKFASKPVIQYASKPIGGSPQESTQNECLNLSTHQQNSRLLGPSQEQTKPAVTVLRGQNKSVDETRTSFPEYEKGLQDFLRELRETTNAGTGKCNNKTATNINQNTSHNKEIKKEAKPNSRVSNVTSKVESAPSHCAKLNTQGKKVETQLNTFARLSYMHKNKQNLDLVNQETVLNRSIEEHRLEKLKHCSNIIISRTCNSTNLPKTNTDELVIRKVEKSNVPQNHPVLMNILQGKSNTSTDSMAKNISLQPVKRKSTPTPISSALSEKDQNDILSLLLQQNKLNTHPAPVVNTDHTNVNKIVNNPQCSNINTASSSNYITSNKNVTVIKNHPKETCNNMYNSNQNHEIFKGRQISDPTQNIMYQNPPDFKTVTTNIPIPSKNVDSLNNCSLNIDRNKIESSHKEDQSQSYIAKADDNGKDWQEVMSALLSHKTPSRGPSALDMALKKDFQANKNLRNQRIMRPNVINETRKEHKISSEKDKKQSNTALHIPNAHTNQQIVKSSIPSAVASHSTNTNLARLHQSSKIIESLPKKQNENIKSEVDKPHIKLSQNATKKLLKDVSSQNLSPTLPSSIKKTKNPRKQSTTQYIVNASCTQVENNRKDFPIHQNVDKKVPIIEKPKRIPTVKKSCKTSDVVQEKDPFISGISNSDYDLLEELMDDELRKEIGELSSDEDTYKIQTNSDKCTKIPNSTSCMNVIKNATTQQVKPNIPYTSIAPQSCRESIIQTSKTPTPCQNKPKVISDIKLNNVTLNQNSNSNVKQYTKDCKTDFVANNPQACPTTNNPPLNTNVINRNIEQAPLVSSSHINVVDPRNVIITAIPQRPLQNVVLINSELVYDSYGTLQTNVTNLHTGMRNVNQTPYVAFESTPNLTVFQTTQFAAPLVNPIIIGNAITSQTSPPSMQKVPLDTSKAQSNEVDASQNKRGLLDLQETLPKTNQHNHIPSKPEIQTNNKPCSNNQGSVISQESRQGAKTENFEASKPMNTRSKTAQKDNNTNKLSSDQQLEKSQTPAELGSNSIDSSSKTCERKVLKEVQEKQKVKESLHSSVQKTIAENDNKKIDKELETNVHGLKIQDTKQSVELVQPKRSIKELERLKRKRLRILNRVISNRTNKPPIPLSYTPLMQISKEIVGTSTEINKLDETELKISSSECPNRTERHTDSSKENDSKVSTRRIFLRSSNVIQSKVSDNTTTKSHVKKTKTERKDETRLPSKDLLSSDNVVDKEKQSNNEQGNISNTPDKLSELILKLKNEEKPKKVAKLILKIPKKSVVKGTGKRKPKRLENKKKESKRSPKAKNFDTNLNLIDIEETLVGAKIKKKVSLPKNLKDIANVAPSKKDEVLAPGESMSVESLNRNSDSSNQNIGQKQRTSNFNQEIRPGLTIKIVSGTISNMPHSNHNTVAHSTRATVSSSAANSTSLLKTTVNERDLTSESFKSILANSTKLKDNKSVFQTPDAKTTEGIVSIQKRCQKNPPMIQTGYVPTPVITKSINALGYEGVYPNKNSVNNNHNQSSSSPTVSNTKCLKNEFSVSSDNNLLPKKNVTIPSKTDICQDKNKLDNSLNDLKDKVIIEELPVEKGGNPDKKCVRIKVPNGKSFKATVYGKMHVSFESLFSDPALKNALLSNYNTSRKYTLNVKQVSTQLVDDPSKIVGARIEEINLQPKGDAVETVNLLSDDEEENDNKDVTANRTEFDGYKILSPSEQLFEQHRTKLKQKCFVKLARTKIKSKKEEKPETAPVIELTTVLQNTPSKEEAIADIDFFVADKVKDTQTKREALANEVTPEVVPVIDLSSVVENVLYTEQVFVDIDSVLNKTVKAIQSKSKDVLKQTESTPVIYTNSGVVNAPLNEEKLVDIDKVSKEESKLIQINDSSIYAQDPINLFPSEEKRAKVTDNDEIVPVVDLTSHVKNTEEGDVIEIDDSSNDSLDLLQDFSGVFGQDTGGNDVKPEEKINELKNLLLKDLGVEENQEDSHPKSIDSQSCVTDDRNSEYVRIIKDCFIPLSRCDELLKQYEQAKIFNNQCVVKLMRCDDMIKTRNEDYDNTDLLASDDFIDVGFEEDNLSETCVLSRSGSFSILNDFILYDQEDTDEPPNRSFDRNVSSPVMDAFETIVALKKYSHLDKARYGYLTNTDHLQPCSCKSNESPISNFERDLSSPVMSVFETIVALKKYSHADKARYGFLLNTDHLQPCSCESNITPNSNFERDISSPVMSIFETIVALKEYSHMDKDRHGFHKKTDYPPSCFTEVDASPKGSLYDGRSSPVMDVFETIVAMRNHSHVDKDKQSFFMKIDDPQPCSSEWYTTKRETNVETKSVDVLFIKSHEHCLHLNENSDLPEKSTAIPTLKTLTANYFRNTTILDNYIMCGPTKAVYSMNKENVSESSAYKLKRKLKNCEFNSTYCKVLRTVDNTSFTDVDIETTDHITIIDRTSPYCHENNESNVAPCSILEIEKDMSICASTEDYSQNANLSGDSEEMGCPKLTKIVCCDEAKDIENIPHIDITYSKLPLDSSSKLSESHTTETSDLIEEDRFKTDMNRHEITQPYLNTSGNEDLEQNEEPAIELTPNTGLTNKDQLLIANQQLIECSNTTELAHVANIETENNSMDARIHNTLPHPIAIVSNISEEQNKIFQVETDIPSASKDSIINKESDIDIVSETNIEMELTESKSSTTVQNLEEYNAIDMTEDTLQKIPEVKLIQNTQSSVLIEENNEKEQHFDLTNKNDKELTKDCLINLEEKRTENMHEHSLQNLPKVELDNDLYTIQNIQTDITSERIDERNEHINMTNDCDKKLSEKDLMNNLLNVENSTENTNDCSLQILPKVEPEDRSKSIQNMRSDMIPIKVTYFNKELTENNNSEICLDSTIDISINNTKLQQDCIESNSANVMLNTFEIELKSFEKNEMIDQTVPDFIGQHLVVTGDKCTTYDGSCETISEETVNLFYDTIINENADVVTQKFLVAESNDENAEQCVDLVGPNKSIQCPTPELLDHEYASPISKMNKISSCSEENSQSNLLADEITEEMTDFETSIESTCLDTLEEKLKDLERNEVTLVCKNRDDLVLKGIEYEDPEVGTCYVFPIVDDNDDAEELIEVVQERDDSEIIDKEESDLYDEYILEVNIPKLTYTRLKKRSTALNKFKLNNLKRKSNMNEERYSGKRYRLEKKINHHPRGVTPANFVYGKEYKSVIDYCNSLKFSFSHPFVQDIIDVEAMLTNWPIKGVCAKSDSIRDDNENIKLFHDDDNPRPNPMDELFSDEINKSYNDLEPHWNIIDESNVNMGFGEGSDRVIPNLEEDGDDSKFSAATLSDVKQPQPFLLSEENDTKELDVLEKHSDDQLKKLKHYITYIELRNKVRSFFQKTSIELNMGFDSQDKELSFNHKFSMKHKINCPFDLCVPDFIEPSPIETVVQVVQVGQLPVSAAAQNPVTCDPRVTQVSDASPSQCSVDNSPQDNSQVTIKTEYTELTTADLTLPLVQEYAQHNQNLPMESESVPNMQMSNENIPIETEIKSVVKIELEEIPDVKEENRDNFENNEFQSDESKNDNNVEFSFESNTTGNTSNLDSDSDFQNMFNASEKQSENDTYTQKQQNGTSEKTDQIAHAMNAAGITTSTETMTSASRAHALVNILSQKIRQGAIGATQSATNTFPKTTAINAMALQQALAQILPPPLNQTNVSDNQQSSNTQVTPQVLHIVQGKNATGSQITLVDNSQQSVINNSNPTPVLHIVQNKSGTNSANSNGTATPQSNSFSGLSLVDAGLQQGGNQLLHIVNTGTQKNNNATGQLIKRVNLLTNLANVQGSNEQKMVQFVCKSADGKSIQLNAPHQRSMVLRLQPIETPNVTVQATPPKSSDNQEGSTNSTTNSLAGKDTNSQQEIKSRSVYEENYAKFIQNSSNKSTVSEKSTSLPKFNQAFGKPVFQDGNQKSEVNSNSPHLTSVSSNNDTSECQSNDNAMNLDHISQISSPPLLLRKSPQTSQSQASLVQQLKQTIAPMNIQTMHGGVIYTRQIPVNIGGGQTINLITVPSTELIDDSGQKQQSGTQNEIEQSIIKIVPQTPSNSNSDLPTDENNVPVSGSNENTQNTQPQPVLTQMRIKLPMLSKAPQMVSGARVVRPSFFQIQRNVIGGANQPVYQQLVLTAAPPLGQQTIRLPQAQTNRPIKVPSESQSSAESQMSSSTLEQLREFDMVLEQVKERSTVQPGATASATFPKLHTPSSDTTDSTSASSTSTESTQQVLYSIGNNQPLNVAYVNRKATVTTPSTSSFVRSPDSSGIVDSPTSSSHVQIPHTVTSETTQNESPTQPKTAKVSSKSKSRPKASSNPPNTLKLNTVPPKTSAQKPLEDEQTTQRILYILAEYKEQVENSPDKDKPAPRRRSNPPSNPGSSKRKKSSSGSRRHGARELSPVHGEDTCRTMGSEDSSCGTSQGDCNESCLESHSPQDSPRKVVRKLTFEQETPTTPQPRPQPQRNVIVADGQTITVARGTAGKPATAVLMPANYILPVSMVKGGQQIAIVTNRGPKLLTVGGAEGGATNALLLQRLIGPAGLKPVLARPGVRHVRLPTAALHNLQAFNLATTTTIQPPDSTASPAPAPTPPELVDTRANSSPWTDRDMQDVKPERASSPEGSEPWNLPSSGDPHDYSYEETVRADNLDRTVLDPIPDRYSPDMEAQRIFDKMFDVESKKSYMGDSHDDSPRCGYDIDASDCDDKAYHQVVQKKDGSSHRQHRLTHVSAAALRHKYAILEHELRLQKSLSEECEDLGVDSPSASELFPEAELLFAASPAHDHTQDQGHHSHTPQPTLLNQSGIPQPDIDDQIATDQLLSRNEMTSSHSLSLGLEEGIVVSEDGMPPIALDQEEFARAHPNTTFHSEPTDGEVQPFTIAGIKGRHITSTIFHSNRAPATVLMTTPQTTVISQATADNSVKYDIDNMINSLPSTNNSNINLASVLVKDEGLTRFDNILSDSRELHLSNTASAIVHSAGNAAQVIRRVCYDEDKRDNRFLMDEPDALIAGDDAKMIAEDSSRDATMESMPGDVDDDRSSPERHAELFWESNSASASESRRPLDFSSDSEKCCKSPSYDETNSTDSSGVGTHMRLDSVIKEARGIERSGSADGSSADDTHPPLRTYPPKRMYHPLEGEVERSLSGKTRAGERSPDSLEVRRRASGRGVVKRGCHCCNGSPAPPRPKKSRQRKPTMDFNTN